MIKYVIYKRVSTKDQGKSGLGLEAQNRDINVYLDSFSGQPYKVIGEFVEIYSGGADERPELKKTIELAKREKAILLVSKLDRLSRKVSFIATLMDDNDLEIKVAQMPHADKFQLHIYAALAEQEREFISERTKAALKVIKASGKRRDKETGEMLPCKLGGLRDKTMKRNEAWKKQAEQRAKDMEKIVMPMRREGMSLREIAEELNRIGQTTVRGKPYQATQVKNIIDRICGT